MQHNVGTYTGVHYAAQLQTAAPPNFVNIYLIELKYTNTDNIEYLRTFRLMTFVPPHVAGTVAPQRPRTAVLRHIHTVQTRPRKSAIKDVIWGKDDVLDEVDIEGLNDLAPLTLEAIVRAIRKAIPQRAPPPAPPSAPRSGTRAFIDHVTARRERGSLL